MIRSAFKIREDFELREKTNLEKKIKDELERIEKLVEEDISKGKLTGNVEIRCADYPKMGERIKIELKNSGYILEQKEKTNKFNDKQTVTYAVWSF